MILIICSRVDHRKAERKYEHHYNHLKAVATPTADAVLGANPNFTETDLARFKLVPGASKSLRNVAAKTCAAHWPEDDIVDDVASLTQLLERGPES